MHKGFSLGDANRVYVCEPKSAGEEVMSAQEEATGCLGLVHAGPVSTGLPHS